MKASLSTVSYYLICYFTTDILKEMSYNPKMGEQFGFVMSTSTRFRYDRRGDFVYPDENYGQYSSQLAWLLKEPPCSLDLSPFLS
jgi:hypothetical protein